MKKTSARFSKHVYKIPLLMACLLIVAAGLAPFLVTHKAEAYNQIINRSLTLSSGVPSATGVTYTFTFTVPSTVQVQGLKFIACTSAVDTYPGNTAGCTAPAGFSLAGGGFSAVTFGTQSSWQGATNFAVDPTGANDCVPSATDHNIICATRSDTTSQTATSRTISFSTITNPQASPVSAGTPFYVGMYTYQTVNYIAPQQDFGATASAVVQTLTTNAAVAEVLNFCVGSTTIDDTSTSVGSDCSAITGTSINLGTLDTSLVTTSPVLINGGDSKNAVAMVRSNAGNGITVAYDAIQQSGSHHLGTLRIAGQTCNQVGDVGADGDGNTKTDFCINATSSGAQTVFVAGTEMFGMTIAGINGGSTTSYTTCAYGDAAISVGPGDFCNMKPLTGYICDGATGGTETYDTASDCANGYAWDETGTAVNIASSASSTVKQVDDEAIIMKYAATPSITTPFGPYQAQTDFIAVPVY